MTTRELLRHRLVFTVGKGGVGRTTITLLLALAAARRGLRVLLVELEGAHGLGAALEEQRAASPPPPGIERISLIRVDGKRALEEYLTLIIPVRRLLKTIFSSRIYQYFVAAAPGLKELMTIGKIWFEAERRQEAPRAPLLDAPRAPLPEKDLARPLWDVVLVDGPATGHSLQVLRMPQAALEAFPAGLVHREAERILKVLRDPEATAVVIVAMPEEMPVNETIEIYAGLQQLALPTTLLVLNQVHAAPCSPDELATIEQGLAAAAGDAVPIEDARVVREVLARAVEESGWAAINSTNIARLTAQVSIPMVCLPFLFSEEFGADQVETLLVELTRQLDEPRARPRAALRARREHA